MKTSEFAEELYKRYGAVTRAKNCFLYTKKGVRITDLFQENGRAILGWEGGSAFTHLKNVLSRGQTGSFICEDVSRVAKAVSLLLNSERKIFYFNSKADALKAATTIAPESTSTYKPWTAESVNWEDVSCVVMAPPVPWTDTIYLLAVKDSKETPAGTIKLPYAMEAAITRAIYNLIDAIKTRAEKDWFIYDPILTKYFERKGPYLYSKVPAEKYDNFVLHCLDLGIAINPDFNNPSIIPFGADKGVFTKLKNSPFDF